MAALQKIRNKAGLLIGVLGFALAAFVLGDLFSNGSTYLNKFRDKAFVVDGDVVSTGDYQERITEWENFQKMLTGKSSLDEASLQQIREATYQQMVREMMLDKEAEKIGTCRVERRNQRYGLRRGSIADVGTTPFLYGRKRAIQPSGSNRLFCSYHQEKSFG